MIIASNVTELKHALKDANFKKHGFIPTMGALHEGHLSLVREAKKNCDFVSLSIYLNPTQFNNKKDFELYPTRLEKDIAILKKENIDLVFCPRYQDIYPDNYRYKISEKEFSKILCGKDRPGHFDGVLTVVMKLLNLMQADFAYFGEKDYQQLELIKGLVEAFFIKTQIIGLPTIREKDGLAMSSRNLRLSSAAREKAASISKLLHSDKSALAIKEELKSLGFSVDYVEEIKGRRYIAAVIENIRLIDNARME